MLKKDTINLLKVFFILLSIFLLVSCVPGDGASDQINTDIADQKLRSLIDLTEKQDIDSLLLLTSSNNATERLYMAKAFASIKEPRALDSLTILLDDPVAEVKEMAAYALGQSYDEQACNPLIQAFVNDDSTQTNTLFNQLVLEAVGKVCTDEYQNLLAQVKTYTAQDDHLLKGQALALYRFALRNITSDVSTDLMVNHVNDRAVSNDVKLIAANYLARAKNINIDSAKYRLSKALSRSEEPDTKMALALALGKTNDPEIAGELITQLNNESDYRVQCNIIRSLQSFDYALVAPVIIPLLNDPNTHVAHAAVAYFSNKGIPQLARNYIQLADSIKHNQVRAAMYRVSNSLLPSYFTNSRYRLNTKLNAEIENSADAYDKIAFYSALFSHPSSINLAPAVLEKEPNIIRSNILNSLNGAMSGEAFDQVFRTNRVKFNIKKNFYGILKKLMLSGDDGVIAAACGALSNAKLSLKDIPDLDHSWMDSLAMALDPAKGMEALSELNRTIDNYGGKQRSLDNSKTNKAIDWDKLEGVTDTCQARLITSKGDILLSLKPSLAPGTVANFIALADANFYDEKSFHRVVPNFVIQGGCPRGDGYGSLDYSLNSYLGPAYYDGEGKVGMASIGPHTEGTQFFITHSPTMHLDGKYTLFASVIDGMDVVHQIEQGDRIKDVQIIK